ncbi:MAG: nucleotidyltransferase family protein [Pseudomonadota bacterium]
MAGLKAVSPANAAGHVALLLAAGGSTRLGRPKQLLTRNGVPLVRCMAEAALATMPENLFVVVGAEATRMHEALATLPVTFIVNERWQQGLASSLQAAAPLLSQQALPVLVLGCDQPALTVAHLQKLLAQPRPTDGVRVTDYGAAVGLPALVPAALFQQAGQLRADQGLKALWQQRAPHKVLAPELAFDLDTEADVVNARARGWLDAADWR